MWHLYDITVRLALVAFAVPSVSVLVIGLAAYIVQQASRKQEQQ